MIRILPPTLASYYKKPKYMSVNVNHSTAVTMMTPRLLLRVVQAGGAGSSSSSDDSDADDEVEEVNGR